MNDTTKPVKPDEEFVPTVTINREPGFVILVGARPPKPAEAPPTEE